MISGSTIAAVNVPDSKNTLSRHLHQKRREKARRKKLAREQQKIPPPLRPQISEPTANQAFHDASSKIVPHSQLQNKVATLELQVLEAKKAALQKQLQNLTTANPAYQGRRLHHRGRKKYYSFPSSLLRVHTNPCFFGCSGQ